MDFKSFVNGFGAMTCVISVESFGDGKYGKIRIVEGNSSYIDSIEKPYAGAELLVSKFVPNSEYTDYLTRDLNFEDYSYRAAVWTVNPALGPFTPRTSHDTITSLLGDGCEGQMCWWKIPCSVNKAGHKNAFAV